MATSALSTYEASHDVMVNATGAGCYVLITAASGDGAVDGNFTSNFQNSEVKQIGATICISCLSGTSQPVAMAEYRAMNLLPTISQSKYVAKRRRALYEFSLSVIANSVDDRAMQQLVKWQDSNSTDKPVMTVTVKYPNAPEMSCRFEQCVLSAYPAGAEMNGEARIGDRRYSFEGFISEKDNSK